MVVSGVSPSSAGSRASRHPLFADAQDLQAEFGLYVVERNGVGWVSILVRDPGEHLAIPLVWRLFRNARQKSVEPARAYTFENGTRFDVIEPINGLMQLLFDAHSIVDFAALT